MKTGTVSKEELTTQEVQNLIIQAMVLNHAKRFKEALPEHTEPLNLLTNSVGEELYNLLLKNERLHYQDWGSALWECKELMLDLLTLLAKLGVLQQLPDFAQQRAASMLLKLVDFFAGINRTDTLAFMDYQHCEYQEDGNDTLQSLARYYDFNRLYEKQRSGHFFKDFERENEWMQNATAYYNAHFKK